MVRNLTECFADQNPRFIHLSSISVYGEWGREAEIRIGEPARPNTDYARSKLRAEDALRESALTHWHILRLAPVYAPAALSNVAVRVLLPWLRLPVRLFPEPRHSMVHLESLLAQVLASTASGINERSVIHVVDGNPLGQRELASLLGLDSVLPLPRFVFAPVGLLLRLIPGNIGAVLREFLWKFTRGIVVEGPGSLSEPETGASRAGP